jgi:hypothetical protein
VTAGDAAPSRRGTVAAAIALALAGVALHLGIALRSPPWIEGGLADTDSYLRLLRVLDLWRGGAWYDSVLPWIAPPEGLALHWTRPLDMLILGGALPAMLAGMEPARALHWSAALICPALHILAALAAVWAARAVWPGNWSWLAGIVVLGNLAAANYSGFGRADHHTLVLLCVVLGLGFALRASAGSARAALPAGLVFGLGAWVAPEALLVAVPALAGFGLLWAAGRADAASAGLRIAAGMALAVALALPVERPLVGLLVVEQDRLSLQHLALALAVTAVFAAAGRLPPHLSAPGRVAAGAGLAVLAAGVLLLAWPDLLQGPMAAADADGRLFNAAVVEMQPLGLGAGDLTDTIALAGIVIPALLALALAGAARDARWRAAAAVLLATLLCCAAATFGARRFAILLAAPGAIAAAGFLPQLVALADRHGRLARLGALLAGALVTFLLPFAGAAADGEPATASAGRCDERTMALWLATATRAGDIPRGTVLMSDDINQGPSAAYLAGLRVVTGPYHRLGPVFAEMRAFFDAGTDDAARALAARRDVGLVLVCAHATPLGDAWAPAGLRARLLAGDVPGWLVTRDLPPALHQAGFRLHAVR